MDFNTKMVYPLVKVDILLWKDPPFWMGTSTISMAIFNCYVSSPEGNDLDLVVPPWLRTPPIWRTTAKWTSSRLGKCCYLTGRLFGKGSNWWTWCMFWKMLQEILIWLWVNLEVPENGRLLPKMANQWFPKWPKRRMACPILESVERTIFKKDLTPIRWWSKYIKMIGKIPILRVTISIFMNCSPCLQVKNRHFGLAQAISMVSSDGRKHGELRVQLEGPSFRVLPRISPENGRVLLYILYMYTYTIYIYICMYVCNVM